MKPRPIPDGVKFFLQSGLKRVIMSNMDIVKVLAYGKLNLTLDVTGKSGEYHSLDSMVVTVNLVDKIIVKKRKDALINVTMRGMGSEMLFPEENNAVRAGEAFVKTFRTLGADITIYKGIPMGAGLGGSSADAAGVLNALAKMYAVKDEKKLKELADGLGSDTSYLMRGGLARLRGRGEQVEFFDDTPEMHFILLCPKSGVSTAECFEKFDTLPPKTGEPRTERWIQAYRGMGVGEAARFFGNDLYESAKLLNADVETAYTTVKNCSPLGVSMTGSGSAAYGLFVTRELCAWAKSRYKGKFNVYQADAVYPAEEKKGFSNPFSLGGK